LSSYFFDCDSRSKAIDLRDQAEEGKYPEMTQRQRLEGELSRTAWQLAKELALSVYPKEFQESKVGLISFRRKVWCLTSEVQCLNFKFLRLEVKERWRKIEFTSE
jgi:hypothetical protein